jgi:hypothetical protein
MNMKALICYDDDQLRRIESSIAVIESAQPCYRQNKQALLTALQIERASLLQYTKRRRVLANRAASPVQKRLKWLNAPPVQIAMG